MKRYCLSAFLIVAIVISNAKSHIIFYLHGKILEEQGANAVSREYGAYQYQAILDSFRANGFDVYQRSTFGEYA